MKHFKLTEHTSPADIFLYQENLRANREWAQNTEPGKLVRVESKKVDKKKRAWGLLMALRM